MNGKKHSGPGIASFIISIISGLTGLTLFLTIVVAGVIKMTTPGSMDEKSATKIIIGLFSCLSLFAALVALGLGIAGLFQKGRKKIFAILGTIFTAGMILIMIFFVILGMLVK
jgi:hypothetical protein